MNPAKFVYLYLSSIVLISFLGHWYVFENHNTETLGKLLKALILFSWFLSIALIGYLACQNLGKTWVTSIWLINYFFALLVCMVYLVLYFSWTDFPIHIKTVLASIRNFYLTPFPFTLLLMLVLAENKKGSKS